VLTATLITVLALAATSHARACRGVTEPQWVRSAFATCVRWRESRNGAAAQNLYEIEGPAATVSNGDYEWLDGVPRAGQNWIAYGMWCASGDSPWAPYDGC
jgi:hypothetical protein